MQRFAQVIRIRPDKLDEYRRLHADCWPEILEMMRRQNIRNCSIYHRDGLLFMYYEYVGTDFAADQARFADDPTMQRWLAVTAACQQPVASTDGDGWAPVEELFHLD